MIHPPAAVALLAAASLTAQSVGVTLEALAPVSVQVANGASSNTSTWPAGPMGSSGSFQATSPLGGGGGLNWYSAALSSGTLISLQHSSWNHALLPNFTCQMGPHEILVEFSSAIPRNASLRLLRHLATSPGVPAPTVQVDIDNDGTIEFLNLPTTTPQPIPVSFGPQPLQVRLIIDAALGAQAALFNDLILSLVPDNNLSIATPVSGCAPYLPPPPPFLQQSYDNLGVDLLIGNPAVIVIGWTAQPTLLSMNGALPCILLPTPDVVLTSSGGTFNLPLPPSIRPATFFAQGVSLTPAGLQVTDGYSVTAN